MTHEERARKWLGPDAEEDRRARKNGIASLAAEFAQVEAEAFEEAAEVATNECDPECVRTARIICSLVEEARHADKK